MVDISSTSISAPGPSQILCKVCNARYAIYTCPRCKIRTCSLPCSSSHKVATNCSGERNKAAFVNMRDYTWGTLMSDFTYLEDVGRKVGEWGAIIGKGSYAIPETGRDANGMRGRGMRAGRAQFRGRGGGRAGVAKTKRDILKTQLEMQDISMDLLPLGMERRQHNQSIWDFKNQTAYLTIEFKFHPPQDPTSSKQIPSFNLLTHRNNIKNSLLSLVVSQVSQRRMLQQKREKGKGKQKALAEVDEHITDRNILPLWLLELVEEIPSPIPDTGKTMFSPFDSLIRAPVLPMPPTALSITGTRPKTAYHRVSPTEPLLTALRNTHFVEYPTLDLWSQGEFSGVVADQHAESQLRETSGFSQQLVYERGDIVSEDEPGENPERRAKRRKIELKAGKKAISGLLGGYGSDDDSGQEEEERAEKDDGRAQNGLTLLGAYADSDEETKVEMDSDEEDEDVAEVSPEVLLELMKKAQSGNSWMDDSKDDDRVDWGDGDSEAEQEEEE
ncbi:uncharacterized protein C8R40DRAFT_806589 [Lentinula edodes]|uniref:uncharacterized protein n=1 Tax=Lentinula edodes TaxID=5353 RepID=UPI001E8D96BB|nr:uncharacterized protein C8R40DRAFT_806589 [Lentinula edodes]KAH7868801.1 hypothetical protein C8R40DRAFT_806589 [Lentinula edodes]